MTRTHTTVNLPKHRMKSTVHKYKDDMSKIEVVTHNGRTNN